MIKMTSSTAKAIGACKNFPERELPSSKVFTPKLPGRLPKDPTKRKLRNVSRLNQSPSPTADVVLSVDSDNLNQSPPNRVDELFNMLREIATDVKETKVIVGGLQSIIADLQPRVTNVESTIDDLGGRLERLGGAYSDLVATNHNTESSNGTVKSMSLSASETTCIKDLQDQITEIQRLQNQNKFIISGDAVTSLNDHQAPLTIAKELLLKIHRYIPDDGLMERAYFLGD